MQKIIVPALPLLLLAGGAFAVDDYTTITSAISVAGVSAAIIGMGALMAAPNVARWASKKLANFFR